MFAEVAEEDLEEDSHSAVNLLIMSDGKKQSLILQVEKWGLDQCDVRQRTYDSFFSETQHYCMQPGKD